MTCKICFGDQTMWRRDANGKAIEVPCSCVAMAPITDQDCGTGPTPILPAPVYVTAMMRPAFDELKEGDVVWMPAQVWRGRKPGRKQGDFQINGLLKIDASVYLTREEYDALPHCPVAYPSPIHASKRAPTEADAGNYGRVLIWDKPDQCWYPIYWTGIPLGADVWWIPWPNLPPPPEQP